MAFSLTKDRVASRPLSFGDAQTLVPVVCALAIAPIAIAAGATATATPTHPKAGTKVQLKVSGLKPNERVRAHELIADGGQTRTL